MVTERNMIDDKAHRKIAALLDQKISDFSDELFFGLDDIPKGHPLLKVLIEKWRLYLSELDMSFKSSLEKKEEGRLDFPNPLYIDDEEHQVIHMSKETATKILVLGLP